MTQQSPKSKSNDLKYEFSLRVNYITFNFYSIELQETLNLEWTWDTKNRLILTVGKPTMTKMYIWRYSQEFNDDDFKHHLSPSKKVLNLINLSLLLLQVNKFTNIPKFWRSSSRTLINVFSFLFLVYRDKAKNPRKAKT